ncbi:hypothetical protein FP026_03465 [Rhizobium tropici]|uniref:DUF7674 domain-containing protein n=2 Tax=Rhizobium tropici TaxID=398 RepID=A0A5B0WEZ3_RHITR|nr:hypothetical protein FP026_03465 [Rhizobium tropici]
MSKDKTNQSSFEFDRSNMFEPLLEADPSFCGMWESFKRTYESDDDELPNYIALAELARHLVQNLETGNTNRFSAVFDVVERWHLTGDPYVKETATIGLLEDLQNTRLHRNTRPEDFLSWLQPETRIWWVKVQEFWTTGKLIR